MSLTQRPHLLDSSTIQPVLNSIDWARHRARKATAKLHRLAGVLRAVVWVRRSIVRLLEMYGTAGGWKSGGAKPKRSYLQVFQPFSLPPMGQHLAKSQEIPEHGHDFLKTSLENLFHNRKNARSKCQFRRLDLSGFVPMRC